VQLTPGARLRSAVCNTEVVVVRAPGGDTDLRCGGSPMTPAGDGAPEGAPVAPHDGGTLVGKRYTTDDDAVEVLCTKPGEGSLSTGDVAMTIKGAKPLPSSD
jgi:hypothetical protein